MRTEIAIWNVLHDGEITAVEAGTDGSYTMFVNIPYLRKRLKPLGDSFVLTLSGVRQVTFQDFNGTSLSLEEELQGSSSQMILRTLSESMPITVELMYGTLILDFESIALSLDTGQPVEFETIETVCREYWEEFSSKGK